MSSSASSLCSGRRILLGLTGSIAVYKSAYLVRLLKQAGAEVQVIMSRGARMFVEPLTFATLSERPVRSDFHNTEDGRWNNHVSLGLWADLFVVAPLSAHTLSKMTYGHADNLLIATYLSARSPILVAPAMDLDMYAHPSTQHNLGVLRDRGHHVLDAEEGPLASGLSGQGRMPEPEAIYQRICGLFDSSSARKLEELQDTRVLVTAGPTYEPMDPVRFIGNKSSGKMGLAIAEAFAEVGAQVDLIMGPTHLALQSRPRIKVHRIETAEEMSRLALQLHSSCRIAVFAAAVADYRPKQSHTQKIKKRDAEETKLSLVKNPDIAYNLAQQKKKGQLHVGFALETQNAAQNAAQKLRSKSFDLLVCNSLEEEGAGFYHDTNKVTFFYKDGRHLAFPLKSKRSVASDILNAVHELLS